MKCILAVGAYHEHPEIKKVIWGIVILCIVVTRNV